MKIKAPIFGPLALKVAIARFTRTLAILLRSGVPVLTSMDIVKNVVSNRVLEHVIEEARDNIREGQDIAPPLRRSQLFPPLATHMIAVGEKVASSRICSCELRMRLNGCRNHGSGVDGAHRATDDSVDGLGDRLHRLVDSLTNLSD